MNNDNNDISSPDRDSHNRAYNAARAEWHRHRAASAVDGSTRMLHEKFVILYRARAEARGAATAQSAEFE